MSGSDVPRREAAAPGAPPPSLSVVIETLNEQAGPKVDLEEVLAGLEAQSFPRERLEVLVVVTPASRSLAERVRERHPWVRVVECETATYYGMKTSGIEASTGEVVALLDSDCVPERDWAASIAARVRGGADVVAGKTRYPVGQPFSRTFDFFNFGYIQGDASGRANGFLPNNAAFRREVIFEHPFDQRIRRSGAAHLLGHKLIGLGYRLAYEPGMRVRHNSYGVAEELRMRVKSGFDSVNLARIDEEEVLEESRYLRRTAFALLLICARRIVFDLRTLRSHRHDLEVPLLQVPFLVALSPLIRGLELVSALVTLFRPDYFKDRYGW